MGKYENSKDNYEKALRVSIKLFGPDHWKVAAMKGFVANTVINKYSYLISIFT
jgi:hypothetical protein